MRTVVSRLNRGLRFAFTLPILVYQKLVSPVLPSSCIYAPTCSHYARTALLRHGVLKGLLLAVLRVFRCVGGLFVGGEDPVPESVSAHYLFGSYKRYWRHTRHNPSVR